MNLSVDISRNLLFLCKQIPELLNEKMTLLAKKTKLKLLSLYATCYRYFLLSSNLVFFSTVMF